MSIHPEIDKLCVFDTLHDFWSGERGDVSDAVHLSTQKKIIEQINQIQKVSVAECQHLKDEPLNKCIMNLNVRSMTNHSVSSASSNFENAVTNYYETVSSLSSQIKTNVYSITYGQIIDAWKKKGKRTIPVEWEEYIQNLGVDDGLELGVGTHPVYDSFGMVQHHRMEPVIAQFITYYMFPTQLQQTPDTPIFFTFDTGSGIIGKAFFDISQSFNIITPANIADSATTSLLRLGGRSVFHFPTDSGSADYTFQSNLFSRQYGVKMSFANNKYSSTNPFGFVYQIQPSGGAVIKSPFSSAINTGVSVKYLSEFIHLPDPQKTKPSTSNMMRLDGFAGKPALLKSGVLFDMKRAGDMEQVNSAKALQSIYPTVVVSTIDLLCGLYARTIQQPVMIRNGETIKMYRFSSSSAPSRYAPLFVLKHDAMKALQYLLLLSTADTSSLLSDISEFKQQCIRFIQSGRFLDHTKHTIETVETGETQSPVEKIVEMIAKLRMVDIVSQIDKLPLTKGMLKPELVQTAKTYIEQLQSFLLYFDDLETHIEEIEGLETNIRAILQHVFPTTNSSNRKTTTRKRGGDGDDTVDVEDAAVDAAPVPVPAPTPIVAPPAEPNPRPQRTRKPTTVAWNDTRRPKVLAFPADMPDVLQKIQGVFSLSLNKQKLLMVGENPLDLSASVLFATSTSDIPVLKPVGEISQIYWANKQWHGLYSILLRFGHIVNSKSERLRDKALRAKLTQMEYDDIVLKIVNGFANKQWGEAVKRILLPITETDTQLSNWYVGLENSVTQTCLPLLQKSKWTMLGGGAMTVRGGSGTIRRLDDKRLCVLDLYKLFLQVTSSAAAFVESVFSQSSSPDAIHGGMVSYRNGKSRKCGRSSRSNSRSRSRSASRSPGTVAQTKRRRVRVSNHSQLSNAIALLSQPHVMEGLKTCMENIAFDWEMGLHEIKMDLDNVYTYQPTSTEYILLKLMSFYSVYTAHGQFSHNTDTDGNRGNLVMSRNDELFSSLMSSERGDKRYQTQMNDIALFYLAPDPVTHKQVPAEVITVLLLCILDNIVQVEKDGWMKKILGFRSHAIHFSSMEEWERLTDLLYTIVGYMTTAKDREFPKALFGGNGTTHSH